MMIGEITKILQVFTEWRTRTMASEFSETGNTMPSSVSNLLIDNGAEDLGPSTIEAIDSDED